MWVYRCVAMVLTLHCVGVKLCRDVVATSSPTSLSVTSPSSICSHDNTCTQVIIHTHEGKRIITGAGSDNDSVRRLQGCIHIQNFLN